jgi:integrase
MTVNSTKSPVSKPEKPYLGFPLFAHEGSGQWAKKIRKRLVYFGAYRNDQDGVQALERFNREWPYLSDGREPPAVDVSNGCTVQIAVNQFLASKEEKLKAGELSHRMFRDYYAACSDLVTHFGRERRIDDLRSDGFRKFRAWLATRLGPVSLKSRIIRCRSVLNYAFENQLVDKPINYGSNFGPPSALTIRRDRNQAGPKLFTREEVLRIFDSADPVLRAMTLLGLNAGLGNNDIANLKDSHIKDGWLEYPRAKTGIPRRIPLWKKTLSALEAARALRHPPADPQDKDLIFLTRLGQRWVRVQLKKGGNPEEPRDYIPLDALSQAFKKLFRKLGINGRRGLGFYSLRHNLETIGGECRDQAAVDAVMGHVDGSMAANYRHGVSDERLLAVVETVRIWLEGGAA